jgi:alkyldihydroxyacetonephosphate synthase
MRQYDERETKRLHESATDCALIMVHEGPAALVDAEVAAVTAMAVKRGLGPLPAAIVEHWLGHRNNVAPWDQILSRNMVADTVEVSAPWDRIAAVYEAATKSVSGIEGCRASSAHSSHAYRSGLNLYFTFAVQLEDTAAMEGAYFEAWRRIMQATADNGGSLAHHHGIGRVRRDWMKTELGAEGAALLRRVKAALDPKGIMNPGVLIPDA